MPSPGSKQAMNAHWQVQRAIARAKASVPLRASREDEVAAIEAFVAAGGVTRCPPPEREADPVRSTPVRSTNDRPRVQPGWKG